MTNQLPFEERLIRGVFDGWRGYPDEWELALTDEEWGQWDNWCPVGSEGKRLPSRYHLLWPSLIPKGKEWEFYRRGNLICKNCRYVWEGVYRHWHHYYGKTDGRGAGYREGKRMPKCPKCESSHVVNVEDFWREKEETRIFRLARLFVRASGGGSGDRDYRPLVVLALPLLMPYWWTSDLITNCYWKRRIGKK